MNEQRRIDVPRPGYFKMRSRRAGPWLPAQIVAPPPLDPETGEVLDRSVPLDAYEASINGRPADVWNVWIYGHPINKDEYEWLKALTAIHNR